MRYLVSGKEMKLLDQNTSQVFHVPELVLMEQASMAFVQKLLLLITNTNFGKKKGGKDNDEVKTADEKTEIITSPEDIITDEKEERKI